MLAAVDRHAVPHAPFRPDIEGLRALAVLGVMLFHAHLPGFSGGFIGVDVFFVISGYLICGLLHRELASTGRIDVVAFWLKRARRLMPNAVATLLATTLATALLLPAYRSMPGRSLRRRLISQMSISRRRRPTISLTTRS
jgi:peptidoglycan/LPS O-acetylase OafA/YrhL